MTVSVRILAPFVLRSRLIGVKAINNVHEINTLLNIRYSSYYSSTSHPMTGEKLVSVTMAQTGTVRFEGKTDRYKGVTVHSEEEKCENSDEFKIKLEESLKFWEENGNRGIWFKVYLTQVDWVPILAKNGFRYHHAKEEYVMMYRWMPKLENNNIPPYAHTMIGVGAVVVNDKSQVLVICEKYPILNKKYWKLPGGYVEPGENLVDAAIREVHEETNIRTEFISVLTLRHTHQSMFNCSDIYTVVSLRPLSEEIEKCEREIAECKWMDINEYLEHPMVHELNRFFVQKYLEYSKHNIKINCFHGIHKVINKPYTVYSVTRSDLEARENGTESNSS